MNQGERPGLELAKTFIQTGANYREFKRWLNEELAAIDAESDEGYTEHWDDSWSPYNDEE